jgi:predicted murein hydrolase (TIGR00659 family)
VTLAALKDLGQSPVLWLTVTLVVFAAADWISVRSNRNPLCHPILLSAPVLMVILAATHTSYSTYANGTQVLAFLLGPAVVGLALPIWAQRATIRRLVLPLAAALLAGALTAVVSAVGIAWLFGVPPEILASIAPRAVTTPVAMAMATQLGGIPSLAAVIVMVAGATGGVFGTALMNFMRIRDYRARGFAIGVTAHGFGAARAFQVNETAGTYASLGMALNAVFTSVLLSVAALML